MKTTATKCKKRKKDLSAYDEKYLNLFIPELTFFISPFYSLPNLVLNDI